jgi:endonuclease/exonuclease/phosphatase family metal-dependent hydrolase
MPVRRFRLVCLTALGSLALGALTQHRSPAADPQPLTVRVVTYNVHHGEGTDGKLDLPRLAGVIAALKPDLVALQELDVKTRRTGHVDQPAKLGELTGLHVAFGKAMDFDGGQYGNAVLSRFPIRETRTHALPTADGHEPRCVLEVRVRPGDGGPAVTFLSTHLDHKDTPLRIRQAERIAALYADATGPVILAGDLNAVPDSPPVRALRGWNDLTAGRGLLTSPSTRPKRQIDYVLARPAGRVAATEAKAVEEGVASDHRPVLAVVQVKAE